jgi:hypothetical protein
VLRFAILLLGMLGTGKPGRQAAAWAPMRGASPGSAPAAEPADLGSRGQTAEWPAYPGRAVDPAPARSSRPPNPGWPGKNAPGPRRRLRRRVTWAAVLAAAVLIFRRAIAAAVLTALAAVLHVIGLNVHLPRIRFAWPWQTISEGSTTNTDLGPWVLQKIEGISKPALGQVNFNFVFTRKVSKNIGPWPCWYSSTFYAVGHAAATVDLNPGPAWWRPSAGHYRLQILSRPLNGAPGRVSVAVALPRPQLPQSVHDVTIDNVPSKPISVQHSWTYPGFGCGVVLRPQFPESVLYSQAQYLAFYKARHVPQVTRPLISTAETEAARTIRDNFIQPTVNAFGYTLARFVIHWAAAP